MSDSTNERLGIELDLTISPKFATTLAEIQSKLEGLDVSKLSDKVKTLEKSMKGLGAESATFSKLSGAQFTKLNEWGAKYGVVLNKGRLAQADLNKELAKTANHQRENAQGLRQIEGVWMSVSKASALLGKSGMSLNTKDIDKSLAQLREYDAYIKALKSQGKNLWQGQIVSTKEWQRQMAALNGDLKNTKTETSSLSISIGHMAKRLVEFYAIRGMMMSVTNQIREAVGGVVSLSQTLAEVGAISTASSSQMNHLREVVLEVGRTSKFTANEVAQTVRILAQAGVKASELAETTKTVEWFATGTGSGATEATKAFTTAMNVWNISAKDSTRISSTLTAALNNSKLTVNDLSTSFNYLANQGAIMGMSLEETTALIATMANQGMRASTIGTSMANFIARLTAPTARMKKMLEDYGITLDQINPRLHSFAEVIGVFQEKGVTAERIFQAMEKRVGRGVVTALLAGREGMEAMTDAISGSNADMLAYVQSMEGAEAKINVLKSEFLVLTSHIVDGLAPAVELLAAGLTNLIRGLDSGAGKVAAALAAVVAGVATVRTAITSLKAVGLAGWLATLGSPIGIAVGAIAALAAGITAVGYATSSTKRHMDTWLKRWADQASVIQRTRFSLLNLKSTMASATDSSSGLVEVTDAMREQLEDLIALHPELEELLENERVKYTDIAAAIDSATHAEKERQLVLARSAVAEYNADLGSNSGEVEKVKHLRETQERLRTLDSEISALAIKLTSTSADGTAKEDPVVRGQYDAAVGARPFVQYTADKLERETAALTAWMEKTMHLVPSGYEAKLNEETLEITLVVKDKAPATRGDVDLGNPASAGDLENARENAAAVRTKLAEDLAAVRLSTELRLMQDSSLSITERMEHLAEAKKQLTAKLAAEEEEALAKRLRALANGMGPGLLDDSNTKALERKINEKYENGTYMNDPKDRARWQGQVDTSNSLRQQYNDLSASIIAESKKVFAAKLAEELVKLNITSTKSEYTIDNKKPTDVYSPVSRSVEKDEATRLYSKQVGYNLDKKRAWTAEQVRDIEDKILAEQIDSLKTKQAAYQVDLDQLEARKSVRELEPKEASALDEIKRKQEAITAELRAQEDLQKDRANPSLGSSFVTGLKTGVRSQGTAEDATEKMGTQVATVGIDGVTTALDNMVTSLQAGENGWKSFSASLKSIMAEILKTLQSYIIKLLVVAAVKKIAGIAAASSGGDTSFMDSGSGNWAGADSSNFSLMAKADGGFIPLGAGEANKDSVPAMLMPGEFVLNKKSVDHYGVDTLFKMNAQKFADGGSVGSLAPSKNTKGTDSSKDSSKDKEPSGDMVLNIVNVVDPSSIPRTSDAEIINVIQMDAAKNGPLIRTLRSKMGR